MRRETDERGSAIFFIIILLAVVGGGYYYLTRLKQQSDAEGQTFARTFVERVVMNYDLPYLRSVIASDRSIVITPAKAAEFVETCRKLGKPEPNYRLEGKLVYQNYFFSPDGSYTTTLTYPDRHATLTVVVTRPNGIWLLRDYSLTWERPMD